MLTTSQRRRNLLGGLRTAEKYFMGTASVQLATRRISEALRDLGVPYAIAGGIAVTVHGHVRVTNGVDVLLTSEGLRAFKERGTWMGGTVPELKLASGISAPDRLRDFDDVIQLIRANSLPKEFGALLNQWVQDKYSELWSYAQIRRGEP